MRRCFSAGSVGGGLEVEPDLAGAQPQHPHVGLDVALAVEQRGVAALASVEGLDVVGELALQVLGRLRSRDREHAPLGAVEQPGPSRIARYWASSSSFSAASAMAAILGGGLLP